MQSFIMRDKTLPTHKTSELPKQFLVYSLATTKKNQIFLTLFEQSLKTTTLNNVNINKHQTFPTLPL